MKPFGAMRGTALAGLVCILAIISGCTRKPPGPTLLLPVNPLCTTCNDFIRCDAAAVPGQPVQGGDYELLNLRPKTVLAQMATIFDFLLQAFREREEDRRPLSVYPSRLRGAEPQGGEAVTDLLQHRITVPGGWIDQVNGEWHGQDDAIRGQCRLMPPAEGRKLVERLSQSGPPWPSTNSRPGPRPEGIPE